MNYRRPKLRAFLNDWFSPSSMENDYEPLPKSSGVYFLVLIDYRNIKKLKYKVLYIGMSNNLARRLSAHQVKNFCEDKYSGQGKYVKIYLKKWKDDLKEKELDLIRLFDPPYNFQGRIKR